ncbi:MAG: hypothetical protein U0V74_09260 [Chitinophagales bacterium]
MKTIFSLLFVPLTALLFYTSACNGKPATPAAATVISKPYDSLKAEIERARLNYLKQYNNSNAASKDSLVTEAHNYLLRTITTDIFQQWYNTPWSFYGNTKKPGSGSIACGYFVTTVLKDAGFNIPATAWAQLASESMIVKLNPAVKRFSRKSIEEFTETFKNEPDGLYIVGLDCHVGFVSKINGELQFTHSSYYQPDIGVMSENPKGHNPLNDSKYRVLGEILHRDMVVNWIKGTKYN